MPVTNDNVHTITVQDVLKRVEEKIAYIDTMTIWLPEKPEFLKDLRNFCERVTAKPKTMTYFNRKIGQWITIPKWQYRMRLFRPTPEAFVFLKEHLRRPTEFLINYLEMTLDLITDSHDNRNFLRGFFMRCWVKSHNVSQNVSLKVRKKDEPLAYHIYDDTVYLGTTYIGSRKSGMKYVIYSDRPSKINGKLCCHLEVRFSGAEAIKRERLSRVDRYLEPDLFHKFWGKHLKLRRPKELSHVNSEVARIIRKKRDGDSGSTREIHMSRSGRRFVYDDVTTEINLLQRFFTIDGMYTAQNLVDYGKDVDAKRRFLESLKNEELLPPTSKTMIIYTNEQNNNNKSHSSKLRINKKSTIGEPKHRIIYTRKHDSTGTLDSTSTSDSEPTQIKRKRLSKNKNKK